MSSAEPMVRCTRAWPNSVTRRKSSIERAPPAYVAGTGECAASQLHQALVDPLSEPFDIDAVNEEFVAPLGQAAQRVGVHAQLGEGLPAIGHDEVLVAAPPATQSRARAAAWPTRLAKLLRADRFIEFAVAKQPRGNDHVRRPGVDPPGGVVGRDAAADLQSARPGGECLAGGIVIALAQLDHVAAAQVVATVQLRIPSGRFFRDEVGAQGARPGVVDGAPDDLFHPAFMQVNARSEHAASVRPLGQAVEFRWRQFDKKARVAARFAVCSPAWMPIDRFATSP